jgi:branched-chain amino acid transport system permease protein
MILTLFGGAGTLWGPLIGAVVLVPLSEVLHGELGNLLPGVQGIVYGIAIILVILVAPEGIYWRLRDLWLARPSHQGDDAVVVPASTEPTFEKPTRTGAGSGKVLLSVRGLSKLFGGLRAVDDVSFDIRHEEIVGIIGPNGAGKTTLFNLLNGLVRPDAGEVMIAGRDLVGLKPNQICRLGIGRTFQVGRSFPRMTVLQNVLVGAYVRAASDEEASRLAHDAVAAVGLAGRASALAGSLTNKELRLMEIARAVATAPRLVLLDEPLAGLGASETQEVIALVAALRARGITVAIIEHTMHAMVTLVDRMIVLNHGRFLREGSPMEVTRDAEVIAAYLGPKWVKKHALA